MKSFSRFQSFADRFLRLTFYLKSIFDNFITITTCFPCSQSLKTKNMSSNCMFLFGNWLTELATNKWKNYRPEFSWKNIIAGNSEGTRRVRGGFAGFRMFNTMILMRACEIKKEFSNPKNQLRWFNASRAQLLTHFRRQPTTKQWHRNIQLLTLDALMQRKYVPKISLKPN